MWNSLHSWQEEKSPGSTLGFLSAAARRRARGNNPSVTRYFRGGLHFHVNEPRAFFTALACDRARRIKPQT